MTEPLYLISAIVRQAGLGDGMRCKCATKADVRGSHRVTGEELNLGLKSIARERDIYVD